MFTKQHYKAIAEIIAKSLLDAEKLNPNLTESENFVIDATLTSLKQRFISLFKSDNKRFSESKFEAYINKLLEINKPKICTWIFPDKTLYHSVYVCVHGINETNKAKSKTCESCEFFK